MLLAAMQNTWLLMPTQQLCYQMVYRMNRLLLFSALAILFGAVCDLLTKPHERIAVLGIGGLGHLAVQYSKAAGFYTIAITHSKDKEDLASKLGADLIVSNGEALKQAGGGADVILVTSNSYKAASESLKGLRPDGRMVLMGFSTEPLIVTSEIIGNRSRIIGSIQNDQEYLHETSDYVAKGKVKGIAQTLSMIIVGLTRTKLLEICAFVQ